LLEQAGSDPTLDRLFLLGDEIDRGRRTHDLLRWALEAENVYSIMGNHEPPFRGGSFSPQFQDRHVVIGGEWSKALDKVEYHELAAACASHFPLTMTLECKEGILGLVHAKARSMTGSMSRQRPALIAL
jgi:serine/threonine protein phosphatase 1